MEPGGCQLLSGSALADQEHGPLDRSEAGKPFLKFQESLGLAQRF
jgi:hypothetical protein